MNPATVFMKCVEAELPNWNGIGTQYDALTEDYTFRYGMHDRQISIVATGAELQGNQDDFPTLAALKVEEALQ